MKRSIASRVRAGIVALVFSIATIVLVAPAASAAPAGCQWGSEGSFSWAHCNSGTGGYQAWAQCKPRYPWISNWYMAYGPWLNPGGISRAYCDGNHTVASYGITR